MKLQGKKEEVGCRSGLHKDDTLWFIASVAGIADAATKHCFETNRMPFLPSVLFFTPFLTGESFELRMLVMKYLFPILRSREFSHSFFFFFLAAISMPSLFHPYPFLLGLEKVRFMECICTFIIWQMLILGGEINSFLVKINKLYRN